MASSGVLTTNKWQGTEQNGALQFSWTATQSIDNNTSTISWTLKGVVNEAWIMAGGFKVVIDGDTVYSKDTDYRIKLYNGTVVASGTKTITHKEDGTRSFAVTIQGGIYTFAVNCTASGSWDLPTIHRKATLSSAPNFTDEENPTITYSNPAGTAVTTLQACISTDGSTASIAYRNISKSGTSYTFNLTDAERTVLRNATKTSKTKTVYFIVKTIVGGVTFTSQLAKTLTIVNANPTFTASQVSYADVATAVVAITGNNQHIVQNQSSLTATINSAATAKKGATITEYTLTLNGVTKTVTSIGSVSFGAINSSQDVTLTVTAKDSRGNTTAISKAVKILAWSAPTISATIERVNNYEDETHLSVNASISSVNGKNTMTITYKYKKSGGSYGSSTTINNNTEYTLSLDKNFAYVFSITVTDGFGEATTREFPLANGKFPLFIDTEKNAVGINEFPSEGEALRVAGIATFDDGIVLKAGTKRFLITVSESGSLVVTNIS